MQIVLVISLIIVSGGIGFLFGKKSPRGISGYINVYRTEDGPYCTAEFSRNPNTFTDDEKLIMSVTTIDLTTQK